MIKYYFKRNLFTKILQFNQSKCFSDDNISRTFQGRSKLNEFYKYVHPDILGNAPVLIFNVFKTIRKENIRQENLRSLKNLNGYLDSLE